MLDLAKTREFRDFVLIRGNNLTEFWQFRGGPEVISNRLWIHKCRSYACGLNHKPCKTFKNPRAFARSEQSPTLNKAIGIGQQHELSQSQMKLMRSEEILSIKQKHVPWNRRKTMSWSYQDRRKTVQNLVRRVRIATSVADYMNEASVPHLDQNAVSVKREIIGR